METAYQKMPNPDRNFLVDFQSQWFDARLWELYVFAAGIGTGFDVSRPETHPDFLMTRAGERVWVEAVTANPSQTNARDLSGLPMTTIIDDALPIRYGTPLGRKLARRYWELPHVAGLPLVIAMADFADSDPLRWNGHSLFRYLYGVDVALTSAEGAPVDSKIVTVSEHALGNKTIPSGFFSFEGAAHISAVVFSNSGTLMKFARMGFDASRHKNIRMVRMGMCYDPNPAAFMPDSFAYIVGDVDETWLEGCVVYHNPNALHPISLGFFQGAVQYWCDGNVHREMHTEFHAFSSLTKIFAKADGEITAEEDEEIRLWARQFVDRAAEVLDANMHDEYERQRGIRPR